MQLVPSPPKVMHYLTWHRHGRWSQHFCDIRMLRLAARNFPLLTLRQDRIQYRVRPDTWRQTHGCREKSYHRERRFRRRGGVGTTLRGVIHFVRQLDAESVLFFYKKGRRLT